MAKFKNYSLTAKKINFDAGDNEFDVDYFNDFLADSPITRGSIAAAAGLGGAIGGAAVAQAGGAALAGGYGAWKGLNTPLASNEQQVKDINRTLGENGNGPLVLDTFYEHTERQEQQPVRQQATQNQQGRRNRAPATQTVTVHEYRIKQDAIDALTEVYKQELIRGVTNTDITGPAYKRLNEIDKQIERLSQQIQGRNRSAQQARTALDLQQIRHQALQKLSPDEAASLVQQALRSAQNGDQRQIDLLLNEINTSGINATDWVHADGIGQYDNIIVALADHQDEIKKLEPLPTSLSNSVAGEILNHADLPNARTPASARSRRANQGNRTYEQRGAVRRKAAQIGESAAEEAKKSAKSFKFKSPKGIAAIGLGLGAAGLAAYNVWKQLSSTLEDKLNKIIDDPNSARKCYYYKKAGKLGKEVWDMALPIYDRTVKVGYFNSAKYDNSREWDVASEDAITLKATPKYIALWIVYVPGATTLNCKFKFYIKSNVSMPYRDSDGKRQVEKALESWDCVEVFCTLQLNSHGQEELANARAWRTNLILDDLYSTISNFKVMKINPIVNFCNDNFLDDEIQDNVKNYGGEFIDNKDEEGKYSAHVVENPIKKFGFNPISLRNRINMINQKLSQEYSDSISLKQQVVSFR